MENWDEEKLRNVVLSKHGNPRTTTDVRRDASPFGPVLNPRTDCVQILYRGHRDSKVGLRECYCLTCPNHVFSRFGWFWECPNGGEKCQYRHALPPGFVLKSQRKAAEEAAKASVISLEEFLEVQASVVQQ